MKKDKNTDLVIEFLNQTVKKLEEEIKLDKGGSKEKIELKSQITTAVENLQFCSRHALNTSQLEVIQIPEGGSDAYFTEYLIVDEKEFNNIPSSSVVKEIRLHCFDLIIRKKN